MGFVIFVAVVLLLVLLWFVVASMLPPAAKREAPTLPATPATPAVNSALTVNPAPMLNPAPTLPASPAPESRLPDTVIGPGTFAFDIVGEASYQDNLTQIAGGKKKQAADLVKVAHLVLEDSNPYDDQAVRIDVDGLTVGHLSRANARKYRKLLAKAGRPGDGLKCNAKINGGWYQSKSQQGHFGVRLDLQMRGRLDLQMA